MKIYNSTIKTLSVKYAYIHLILHHYKDMNSIYMLTTHNSIKKRMLEEIYLFICNYNDELLGNEIIDLCEDMNILEYVFYALYYVNKIYNNKNVCLFLNKIKKEDYLKFIDYYGLNDNERKKWKVPFEQRINSNIYKIIKDDLTLEDKDKIRINSEIYG